MGADLRRLEDEFVPAWLRPTVGENRIPPALGIVAAVVLQLSLPSRYALHPRWILPSLEVLLLVVLTVLNPVRLSRRTVLGKYASLLVVASISLTTVSARSSSTTTSSPARPATTPAASAGQRRRDLPH